MRDKRGWAATRGPETVRPCSRATTGCRNRADSDRSDAPPHRPRPSTLRMTRGEPASPRRATGRRGGSRSANVSALLPEGLRNLETERSGPRIAGRDLMGRAARCDAPFARRVAEGHAAVEVPAALVRDAED